MISIYAGDNLIGIINPIPKISGKVQKVESLGDVMDAKVQE
jgi:cysteine sulfinate desulfinase/cysteine desulfurase-like protein